MLGCGVSNHRVGEPCSLTDSQLHGLIKTGRFFENPLVGRHVEYVIAERFKYLMKDS